MVANIWIVACVVWLIGLLMAYTKGHSKGTMETAHALLHAPASQLVGEVIDGIQIEVEKLLGTEDQLQHDHLCREIESLRSSMRDQFGKVMPEVYVEHCLAQIKDLTRRKEQVEERSGYRVGKQYRQVVGQCAQAKIGQLLRTNTEESIAASARANSTEYQKMMEEIQSRTLIGSNGE